MKKLKYINGNIPTLHGYRLVLVIWLAVCLTACKKDFLNTKPSKSLVVPSTISDYQALLDNSSSLDNGFNVNTPILNEIACGEYYTTFATFQSLPNIEKNTYTWSNYNAFDDGVFTQGDWNYSYGKILNTNIILEGIDKITPASGNIAAWNNVKGSAFFHRAFTLFNLTQEYCKAYQASSANTDLGLPLRLTSDIHDKTTRATLQKTYDQIFLDLESAKKLLPTTPLYNTRPSKPSLYGLLARIYLSMSNYDKAGSYADSCLVYSDKLLDYNKLDSTLKPSMPTFNINPEVIFESGTSASFSTGFLAFPDSMVYQSFTRNDLRKVCWFKTNRRGLLGNWGSYDFPNQFNGIATDEIYLIKAECEARAGNVKNAMDALNSLLITRWKTGAYVPLTAASADDALKQVLSERRKELFGRCLRWSDLRRLNKEPEFAVTLTRILDGQTYQLPPNDPRYIFPIPSDVIRLSGIQQNSY